MTYSPTVSPVIHLREDLKLLTLKQLVEMQHYIDKLISEKAKQIERDLYRDQNRT